jgi:excisionase family DNA binding protein
MTNPLTDPPKLEWPAPLMTVAEVAAVLRVTPKTIRVHIRRGTLRALRLDGGGPYRVRAEDAQAWADRQFAATDGGTRAVDRFAREQAARLASSSGTGRRRRTQRVSA